MHFHLNWAWAQSRSCDLLYYVASDIIIDYIPLNFTPWSDYFRNKVSSNMLLNNLMNAVTYWLSVWVLSMWAKKNPLAVQDMSFLCSLFQYLLSIVLLNLPTKSRNIHKINFQNLWTSWKFDDILTKKMASVYTGISKKKKKKCWDWLFPC